MIEAATYDLEAAGMVSGAGGKLLLSGPAERLFHAWETYLGAALRPFYTTTHRASSLIDRAVLDVAGYLEHFPQNVFNVAGHDGRHNGDGSTDLCLSPAACLHLYPLVSRHPLEAPGFAAWVQGPCARHEGGRSEPPFRLSSFHMAEVVWIGSSEWVWARRMAVRAHIEEMFAGLGLDGCFEVAEDAFFMGSSSGARMLQKLKGLKQEYRISVGSGTVALASVNDHEDYFGRCFGIAEANGRPAASCCAAFGLERLTAIGLLTWGASPGGWPEVLQV